MKKIFIGLVSLLSAGTIEAQLEINSSGLARLGNNAPQYAQLNIGSVNTCIHAMRTGSPNGIGPALDSQSFISGSQWAMGVRGTAYGSNGATNCGVFGIAGNSGTNKSYGIFGSLNSAKGAAIYGQSYNWASTSGATLTSAYAGYFDGNVHVQGNLTYSGTMLITVPSPSSLLQPESLLSHATNRTETTLHQLQRLDVHTYYQAPPLKPMQRNFSEEDYTGLDSMEIAAIRTSLSVEDDSRDVISEQIFSKQHYTLNADQLEKVFPDLVYENEDGTKSINYMEMVPVLVQAINELQTLIDELKGNSSARKAASRATKTDASGKSDSYASLSQNKPNPFGCSTEIEVCVPDVVQSAFVYVYDLQGNKLQQVSLNARGKQLVQLNAASLADGIYLYSLIADGKVVETRRLIVEK